MGEVYRIEDARPPEPGIAMTPTLEAYDGVFAACHAAAGLGLISDNPGTGKTTAAERYKASHKCVVYVRLTPAHASPREAITRILTVMGREPFKREVGAMYEQLRWELRRLGEFMFPQANVLLIVDEVQFADDALIELIRCLHDEEPLVGVVLMGNSLFRQQLTRLRKAGFTQLTSRALETLELSGPTQEDVAAIAAHNRLAGKRPLQKLYRVARGGDGLRGVARVLADARGAGDGAPLNTDRIETAIAARYGAGG